MRQLMLLLVSMTILQINAQTKKTVDSKIDKVTVFLEGAQTHRSAKVNLTAGKFELVFNNISPAIDVQSIQVKAEGNITVLSVIHQQNHLKEQQKQAEISEIETQKETLLEKIALQRNILNVFKQEETMLVKNQQIGGANNGLKAADLKEAADFQRSRLTEVYQKQMETDRSVKKMEAELIKMNRQLAELNQKSDISTSDIHVTVNAKETTNSQFTLTYLVRKSGWYPTYDIRVKDISSPISLQYKANVFQQSGEDWKEVKLFLSTGNPNEDGSKPVINPWFLKYYYPSVSLNSLQGKVAGLSLTSAGGILSGRITDQQGNPVPGASITIKGARTGTAADVNGSFRLNVGTGPSVLVVSAVGMESTEINPSSAYMNISLKEDAKDLSEVLVTSARSEYSNWERSPVTSSNVRKKKEQTAISTTTSYQPTTTIYEIDDPYTVMNDGKTYTVDIDGYELQAQFEYYAAPKFEPDAFLTARIADWQELNLLPGEANLFFEGTFLGKSNLDVASAGDTLNISLGRDKGVVVKRTLLKDFSSRKFMGSNKTDTRQYEIVVRNNKQQPISITIDDQFPISTMKEIEIQDRKYDGAKLDDDTQQLTWQLTVDPKKENKVGFKYEVKYPRDKVLQLD
jgi:Domain of unknown function (DUF4139)/N-terminal domain of unknown function (DUF4140)